MVFDYFSHEPTLFSGAHHHSYNDSYPTHHYHRMHHHHHHRLHHHNSPSMSTGEAIAVGVALSGSLGVAGYLGYRMIRPMSLRDSSTQIERDFDDSSLTPIGSRIGTTPPHGPTGETGDQGVAEFLSATPTGRIRKNRQSRRFF